MNATTASATTAPTTTAPRVQWIHIDTRGDRRSEVHYPINSADGMKKARDYIKKKARQGYTAGRVYTFQSDYDGMIMGHITLIRADLYSFITPGYNEGYVCSLYSSITRSFRNMDGLVWMPRVFINPPSIPVVIQYDAPIGPEPEPTPTIDHYRIRTVRQGVIIEGTNEPTELDARTTAQNIVDADPTGEIEAWIIPVMSDRTLGGVLDVIRYEPPTEDIDWMFPDDYPNLTVRIWNPRTGRTDIEIGICDLDDARAIVRHYDYQVFYSIIDEIDGALLESGEYFPDSIQGAN